MTEGYVAQPAHRRNELQLLDEKQTAALLNCTPTALRRWRREQRRPRYVKLSRLVRYVQSNVEEFVRQSTQQNVMAEAA